MTENISYNGITRRNFLVEPIENFTPRFLLDALKVFFEVNCIKIAWVIILYTKYNVLRITVDRAASVYKVIFSRNSYTTSAMYHLSKIKICIGVVK